MNWYIGLDVGTTNIKANAFCPDSGAHKSCISVPTPKKYAQSGSAVYEYDAGAIFDACCHVLRQVAAQVPTHSVRAIAVSSMAESGILLDVKGRPLCDAIAWFDPRSLPQADRLSSLLGRENIYQITGQLCSSKFGITKLLWTKENLPACYSAAQRWLSINDYILYRLSGEIVSEYSIASRTMAFDIHHLEWSSQILHAAGISAAMFPEVVPGGVEIGRLLPEIASVLGLPRSTAIVTGGHDHACAAIGSGITVPGMALDSMGTSEVVVTPISAALTCREMYLAQASVYPHCSDTLYRALTSMQACGASMTWFLNTLGKKIKKDAYNLQKDSYSYLQEIAEACEECPQLQYYPLLRGSLSHPDAGGVFLGFHEGHDLPHFSKALLDGLCCEFSYQIEKLSNALGITIDAIHAVGGPSQSPYLMQRKASISNLNVQIPLYQEAATFGAALLAAVGCGDKSFSDIRQYAAQVPSKVISPRQEAHFQTIRQTYHLRRSLIEHCYEYI